MTGLEIAEWVGIPVVVVGVIAYNVWNSRKDYRLERKAWQTIAADLDGTLTAERGQLTMQVPSETQTVTVNSYSVTYPTGGEGATSRTEHYTRFQIPCRPGIPLRFALIERTPGQSLSIFASKVLSKHPDADLPYIMLDDPSFDGIFRLRADPPETMRALLRPLISPLSALRYVIWQYEPSEERGALVNKMIDRTRSGAASDGPYWMLSATFEGRLTDSDEFQEIVSTLTSLYDAMDRLGIVADPPSKNTPN